MIKDKNKKSSEVKEKSLVETAQELGGVIVYEHPCYKIYDCEKCMQEKNDGKINHS